MPKLLIPVDNDYASSLLCIPRNCSASLPPFDNVPLITVVDIVVTAYRSYYVIPVLVF
jgi:hypothetical protein